MSRLARVSRRTVLGGMAAGSAFVLAGRRRSLAQTTKLTFIEPFDIGLEYIHEMNAAAGGHFKAQGLDIDIPNARGTAIAVQQVVAKQAAFTRVGALDLMKASASQSVPLVSIATSLQEAIFSLVSFEISADQHTRRPARQDDWRRFDRRRPGEYARSAAVERRH